MVWLPPQFSSTINIHVFLLGMLLQIFSIYAGKALSGISFPDIEKIAIAYGLNFVRISPNDNVRAKIEKVLSMNGAVLCEVISVRDQIVQPYVTSRKLDDGRLISSPIEDMAPFLPRDEFISNMIVKPVEY